MKTAIFPGSFDPVTLGHVEIITRGLQMFDKVIVAIGANSQKQYYFTLEQRMEMLRKTFAGEPRIEVASYTGLTVDFAKQNNALFLLRGVRGAADLEYEKSIALINRHLAPGIETVFLISSGETSHISSTLVREVIKHKADVQGLVPEAILDMVRSRI
jgi:pantetheine-phosphate adenylyltransferase